MATKEGSLTMSGFCQWPSIDHDSHQYCEREDCTCQCHNSPGE